MFNFREILIFAAKLIFDHSQQFVLILDRYLLDFRQHIKTIFAVGKTFKDCFTFVVVGEEDTVQFH